MIREDQYAGMLMTMMSMQRRLDEAKAENASLRGALKEIWSLSRWDYDTMPEPSRRKYREVVEDVASKALFSTNGSDHRCSPEASATNKKD
jgi:hypothetical protein